MQVFEALKQAVKACADIVNWGAGIQEPTRKELAADLQGICARCEAAYDAVLSRLVPVKNAFADPKALSDELRTFASDADTRAKFKPEHLCGQIDQLLVRLKSKLDPLKYSVDYRHLDEIRQYLQKFGDYDGAIFLSYDKLVAELDNVATQLRSAGADQQERSLYAQHLIRTFEAAMRETQTTVREAKNQMIKLI